MRYKEATVDVVVEGCRDTTSSILLVEWRVKLGPGRTEKNISKASHT